MPMFLKTCRLAVNFKSWLTSPGGGGKGSIQADQIVTKILKYTKFCCNDVCTSWEIPDPVMDYCIGSVTMLSGFVDYIQVEWKVGYSGTIGYMNAISHMLDYRRSCGVCQTNLSIFVASEIYLSRIKKFLSRNMKEEWTKILNIDYLNSINCWASLEDLQRVIPFHCNRYKQIIINARNQLNCVPAHDFSFSTSFMVSVLFLMVKASRPMTYQYLTVSMVRSIDQNGIIDQTMFKTRHKYGFDSLIFNVEVLSLLNSYLDVIRVRLNPVCDYVLVCKSGKQLSRLSDIFGRIVFQAIGKYINPTRYRQIIETESAEKLDSEDQMALSEDQKHTSQVAKVHYQKVTSRIKAQKGNDCMDKLRNTENSISSIRDINETATNESSIRFEISTDNTGTQLENKINATTNKKMKGARQKKVHFSPFEDNFLVDGLKKHGIGRWTAILNDSEYKFHPSRKASTLSLRAKSKGYV